VKDLLARAVNERKRSAGFRFSQRSALFNASSDSESLGRSRRELPGAGSLDQEPGNTEQAGQHPDTAARFRG
jgi:hypothetical protein